MREVRRGYHMSRRDLFAALGGSLAAGCSKSKSPITAPSARTASLAAGRTPELRWGVQSGDVTTTSGVVWSRADRPSRYLVEWSTNPKLEGARRIFGPMATEASDLTARLALTGLPS